MVLVNGALEIFKYVILMFVNITCVVISIILVTIIHCQFWEFLSLVWQLN